MNPWTETELRAVAGASARKEYIAALVNGWGDVQKAGLTTPLRLCEFLAQIMHETGGLSIVAENLNYSARRCCEVWPTRFASPLDPRVLLVAGKPEALAESVYGGRLGNTKPGDGYRYRGRGFLQDTGRDCYREYGALTGQPLEEHPDLLENPNISLRVALARWQRMKLNRLADRHYTRAIGNAINRGNPYSSAEPIGHSSRVAYFDRAWAVFGDGQVKPLDGLAPGAHGAKVAGVQERLRELGYPVGKADKTYGLAMARAVAAFKADHTRRTGQTLEPEDVIGPLTEAALDAGKVVDVSPERQEATVKDLLAAGSTEARAGKQAETAGVMVIAGGSLKAAQESGVVDTVKEATGWVPGFQGHLIPVLDALKWGVANFFWVAMLVGGVWIWVKGRHVVMARLRAHQTGANMSR